MLMTNECIISLFENSTLLVYSNTHVSIFASWFRFSFTSSLSVEITSKIYNFFFYCFSGDFRVSVRKCCHYCCSGCAIIALFQNSCVWVEIVLCFCVRIVRSYETAEFVMRPLFAITIQPNYSVCSAVKLYERMTCSRCSRSLVPNINWPVFK